MMTYIEQGLRQPNVGVLALIAKQLDVKVDDLLLCNVQDLDVAQ